VNKVIAKKFGEFSFNKMKSNYMDKFLEKEKLVLIKYLLKTIRYGF
jgi:hypothetical protein